MKLYSFSVYGSDPKYSLGAVANAELVLGLGPDFHAIFHCGPEVDPSLIAEIRKLGATVAEWNEDWHPNGMFWRFIPQLNESFSHLLVRDTDSRITNRELESVSQWFESGTAGHIMRDHPRHGAAMLGGMWGMTAAAWKENFDWSQIWRFGTERGDDQIFLKNFIYPKLYKDSMIHDSFFSFEIHRSIFPTPRIQGEYVGEQVEVDGSFDLELREELIKTEKSRIRSWWLRSKSSL